MNFQSPDNVLRLSLSGMVKMLITLLNFCLLNPVQDKLTYKIKYPVYKREANDKPYTGHDPLYAN